MAMKSYLLRSEHITRWHALWAVGMALLGLAATYEAWKDIFTIALKDEESSQVWLVLLVAPWILWVRRMRFRHCRASGTIAGPLIALGGWWISSYGFYNGVQSFWHGGSVLVVVGCVLSVLGKNVIFRFFPVLAVLVFLIPVPGMIRQQIAGPLQNWLAQISEFLLQLLGAEVQRAGNMLIVNNQRVEIAEACNGMRLVFPLILVVYAFSFGLPLRNSVRFLLLLASPLAAIVCNVIRILPTACLYGYGARGTAERFHEVAGWLMLPLAFGMLYGIIKVLRWAMLPVTRYTLAGQG